MLCEMCGKESNAISLVLIEGAELHLCPDCARFGKAVRTVPVSTPSGSKGGASKGAHRPSGQEKDVFTEMPPMELAPDWPLRIRKAREAMGMSQDQFGVRLSEKSSVIHKLESGSIVPSDALVRKIERTLKIRIRSPPEAS